MPRRPRDKRIPLSFKSFIQPLPTEHLVWLARMAMDEVQRRMLAPQRKSLTGPEPELRLHHSGRTLR
jgi:hypothetical protein